MILVIRGKACRGAATQMHDLLKRQQQYGLYSLPSWLLCNYWPIAEKVQQALECHQLLLRTVLPPPPKYPPRYPL